MASSNGPSFLTFNLKKYHPSLEWNDGEGLLQDPKTHAPHSNMDFKVSLLCLVFLLGHLLISCFIESLVLRHCHLVVVYFCWNFGHCRVWLEILVIML